MTLYLSEHYQAKVVKKTYRERWKGKGRKRGIDKHRRYLKTDRLNMETNEIKKEKLNLGEKKERSTHPHPHKPTHTHTHT